jgi:hypothetical protein
MSGALKKLLALAAVLIACCVVVIWGLSSLDHTRDWNVPGHTTAAGKNSAAD